MDPSHHVGDVLAEGYPDRMRRLGDRGEVDDASENVGILHHDRAGFAVDCRDQFFGVGFAGQLGQRGLELVLRELGHRPGDADVMRMHAG